VFVRFSTIAGERGSADTVRDLRGFAVKFYTREGNYDLVGNQRAGVLHPGRDEVPDLMHAMKPEPHHGMPQASSAHDTFWDFVSLMPESTHALMWLMSDRALPRSLRMMDGFGVHTFRFINAHGVAHFVKFHWRPKLGARAGLGRGPKHRRPGPRLPPARPVGGDRQGPLPRVGAGRAAGRGGQGGRSWASTCSIRPS
jgi:catalase